MPNPWLRRLRPLHRQLLLPPQPERVPQGQQAKEPTEGRDRGGATQVSCSKTSPRQKSGG